MSDGMNEDSMFALLSERMRVLHTDVSDVKVSVNKLTDAITKLALVEERQVQYAQALERAFKAISSIEERVDELEYASPATKRVTRWIDNLVTGAVIVIAVYVLKNVGVM